MSEVLAQREAVMVGLPMARWIDNIRENRFSTTIAIVYLSRHTAVDVTVTAESVTEESFTDYRKETFEFESFPFTGAAICGHPGLSFPGWVATGTEGRGCHTGRILPLYDQQNI